MDANRLMDALLRTEAACLSKSIALFLGADIDRLSEVVSYYTDYQSLLDDCADALFSDDEKMDYVSISKDMEAARTAYVEASRRYRNYLADIAGRHAFVLCKTVNTEKEFLKIGDDISVYKLIEV